MQIDQQFSGGNIRLLRIDGDTVLLEREMRDSIRDWFYWAFRVRGAGGKTVTFRFPSQNRVGYYGAAVSHDCTSWRWSDGREIFPDGTEGFTYRFAQGEDEVYFAHNMLYGVSRFNCFAAARGLSLSSLCQSERGRSVPFLRFGCGSRRILLTARHHACENTGSYVLEGVLSALTEKPLDDCEIICVPFVDYDGVLDGDQGKNRRGHDHNRDYDAGERAVYASCRAIRTLADTEALTLALDFHSPYHLGGRNDKVFFVHGNDEISPRITAFGRLLEKHLLQDAMRYSTADDILPNVEWNNPASTTCARYLLGKPSVRLAATLEVTYFGEADNIVSIPRLLALGQSVAEAIREYLK